MSDRPAICEWCGVSILFYRRLPLCNRCTENPLAVARPHEGTTDG